MADETVFMHRYGAEMKKGDLEMKNERGSTLIVVIAIIVLLGIAALITVPKYNNLVTGCENSKKGGKWQICT